MKIEERNLEIINKYKNGQSMTELVNYFYLHRSTIQRILKKNNVPLHKNKSFIKCNKLFFSKYTNESCYWAGFILADGNIRKNRNSLQIKLSTIDKEHLIKFLKCIECDEFDRVKEYNYGNSYVQLTISLDEFKNDLFEYFDIGPQKTYNCIISDKIPNDKLKHFIRGYMDGDGSISKSRVPTVSFVGTEIVLSILRDYFRVDIGVRLKSKNIVPPITNLKNGVGSLSYSGINANKILRELYSDFTELTHLDRKYKKYKVLYKKY